MDHKFRDHLCCSICFEPYSKPCMPLLLGCFHTFCAFCLSTMSKRDSVEWIKCPICREITHVPPRGLKPNFALMDLVEATTDIKERKTNNNIARDRISVHARNHLFPPSSAPSASTPPTTENKVLDWISQWLNQNTDNIKRGLQIATNVVPPFLDGCKQILSSSQTSNSNSNSRVPR